MGYGHTMYLNAGIKPGVTADQVATAIKPLLEYFGYDLHIGDTRNKEIAFDPSTGELVVTTYGDVCYAYIDIVRAVAANLGRIVAQPGEIWLYDHDTGDLDNAKTVIEFGPSDEAINVYIAERDIEAGLNLIGRHVGKEEMNRLREILRDRIDP